MDVTEPFGCKELKSFDVLDSAGEMIGRIGDMTFTFSDGSLRLSQFILAGSKIEEFLESIRVKKDIDPVFDATLIGSLGNPIKLNTAKNSLRTTLDDGAIPEGVHRLSELEDKDIIDSNGVKIGRAVDIDFDVDGSASITVGGGFFEEKLEDLGLIDDIDIIVPANVIQSIGKRITLNVSRGNLKDNLDRALEDSELREYRKQLISDRDASELRESRVREHESLKIKMLARRQG